MAMTVELATSKKSGELSSTFFELDCSVMIGALLVTGTGYCLIGKCKKPLLCDSFNAPSNQKVDAPLILGAAIFGIGWGWAGFCPGPAIVGVGLGLSKASIFVFAMLVGMFLAKKILK